MKLIEFYQRRSRRFLLVASSVVSLLSYGMAHADLYDRGDGLIYDSHEDITWLQDANLAQTELFGIPAKNSGDSTTTAGIRPEGEMNWPTAIAWIAAMNAANYKGYSDWRLPTTLQPDPSCSAQGTRSSAYFCSGGEMGNLFYSTLGNAVVIDPSNSNFISGGLTYSGPFQNLMASWYWSGTEYAPDSSAFFFQFNIGYVGDYQGGSAEMYVIAVRNGDTSATNTTPSVNSTDSKGGGGAFDLLTLAGLGFGFIKLGRSRNLCS